MSTNEQKDITRFYVIRTGTGHTIIKVQGKDIESFLELLGDLIEAAGDSHEEVMTDFANRTIHKKRKWWKPWKK